MMENNEYKARVIAFYLPQYHPVEVNDKYWGKGFTEWTNVAKAKPLFKGHYQPQIPADLGFYDLRLPEVRKAQADMAREYGIEGFCYWHYWFGNGETILDMPIKEVLRTGEPDFPFCLGWANHSWSNRTWSKNKFYEQNIVFLEQKYLGVKDYTDYFYSVLPLFRDKRYITVDGKPLFLIYAPQDIPDTEVFLSTWKKLAVENGLKGIHFVARASAIGGLNRAVSKKKILSETPSRYKEYLEKGYDAITSTSLTRADLCTGSYFGKLLKLFLEKIGVSAIPDIHDYGKSIKYFYTDEDCWENVYPQIIPRWDKTPRMGRGAHLYKNSTPELFEKSVEIALKHIENKQEEHKILFAFAWNEWGEGAYLEPDIKFGRGYLEALRSAIIKRKDN
jgi:hypothetical protein